MTEDAASGGVLTRGDAIKLVKRLPAGRLAQFEPLSAILVLDVDWETFAGVAQRYRDDTVTDADRLVLRVINHESCHFLQTCLSGYMFDRTRRLFEELSAGDRSILEKLDALDRPTRMGAVQEVAPSSTPAADRRVSNLRAMLYQMERQTILAESARPGDHSLAGAVLPRFFDLQDALLEEERRANGAGLSVLGVVEGAAVAYDCWMDGQGRTTSAEIEAQLSVLPSVYHQLWRILRPAAGERAVDLLLPLVAVALCYEKPHEACLGLLPPLLEHPERPDELCRAWFDDLPELPAAGRCLGSARAIRATLDDRFWYYDRFLSTFEADPAGVSDYDLLAEPMALDRLAGLPICITLRDDFVDSGMPGAEVAVRIVIASIALRVASRRREQKDFERFAAAYFREAFTRRTGSGEDEPG